MSLFKPGHGKMYTVLKGFTHLVIIRSQNMSLTEHIKDVNKTTFGI